MSERSNKADIEEAKEHIDDVFNNSSVPAEQTLSDLKEIQEHLRECFDCLRADGVEGA